MNKILNADWKLVFDKLGTVLVDRRFWPAIITGVLLIFGTPEALDNVEGLSAEAESYTQLILQFLGVVIPYLKLTDAWTKRSPSGLGFKEITSETDVLSAAVIKAIKEQ